MNSEILYVAITMGLIFILGIAFSILIMKSDLLYDKDTARWKSGFNLPGLDAKPEDKVDHKSFKKFIGINSIILFTIITVATVVGMIFLPENPTLDQEVLWTQLFVTILFVVILIPIFFTYSDYKEKYIERVASKKPKHHRIILIALTSLLAIIIGATWIFM